MKKIMPALLVVFVAVGGVSVAQDKKKPTTIKYYGNSFFEIQSSKGTKVFFDPHNIEAFGQPKDLKADIVLMSHSHDDHIRINVLKNRKDVKIIPGWSGRRPREKWNLVKETIKDVKIRSVGVFHDTVQGMKYGINTVFVVEVDGWKIVHLGDLGHRLTKNQIKKIGPIDVLMIPVGGIYTLNGSDAQKVVKQLKPKEYIFPMHYGTPIFNELFSEEEFLEDQPVNQVARSARKSLALNRDPNRPMLLGWKRIDVPGATGYLDTDYAAKAAAGVGALDDVDLVCIHVEAPDEASHEGRADAKVQALEEIDRLVVGPMLDALQRYDRWRILVAPDHRTYLRTRAHAHGAVPFVVAGKGISSTGQGAYDEIVAGAGSLQFERGHELMGWFLADL